MNLKLAELTALLQKQPALRGVAVLQAYGRQFKNEPLAGPAVTVGLSGVSVKQVFLDTDAPRELEITVRFGLYIPLRTGTGAQCANLLETLADVLLGQEEFPLLHLSCGKTDAERTTGAYRLEALGVFQQFAEKGAAA